jgi:hypothetical protein
VNNYQIGRVVYLPPPRPAASLKVADRTSSVNDMKAYRHYSVPVQQAPARQRLSNYNTNGASMPIVDANEMIYQQPQVLRADTIDEQLRRERQRRTMVDRMLALFDDDGQSLNRAFDLSYVDDYFLGNGQLTKDELYSMALRSNMFPKIHYYLKQTSV